MHFSPTILRQSSARVGGLARGEHDLTPEAGHLGPRGRDLDPHPDPAGAPAHDRRKRRNRLTSVLVAILVAASLNVVPTAVSAGAGPDRVTVAVDRATCAAINQSLRAAGPRLDATSQALIATLSDDGCRIEFLAGDASSLPFGVASAAAATTCKGFWREMHLYSGPFETATNRLNIGLCWDGTKVWRQWGPDCTVTTIPGLVGTVTWCGYLGNNTAVINPGDNFYIDNIPPLIRRFGWYRLKVNNKGVITLEDGSCCT